MAVRPVRARHGADRRRDRRDRTVAAWSPGSSFGAPDRRGARCRSPASPCSARVVAIAQAYGDLRNGERALRQAASALQQGDIPIAVDAARAQRRAARRRGGRPRPSVGATGPGAPGARPAPRRARRHRPRCRRRGGTGGDLRGAGQPRVAPRRQRCDRRQRHRAAGATARRHQRRPAADVGRARGIPLAVARGAGRRAVRRGGRRGRRARRADRPRRDGGAAGAVDCSGATARARTSSPSPRRPRPVGSAGSWARGRSCAPTTVASRSPAPVRPAS